ncbi:MAG: PIG-L family deacetylase [Nocardioidaceae bacterium]|nr:PIG-L family deacetylase [Nocardioidaceae bacterium]
MADPLPDSEVERVVVVTAHPDDVDFGVAGTVSTWTSAGIEVTYCICTDGQAGGFDDELHRDRIPDIRRAEQRTAAAEAGVDDVRFLGYVDGELQAAALLVRDISRVIRDVRPQRVITHSPERDWQYLGRSHPDHLAAGEATVRAVYPAARNPYAFPELRHDRLQAWTVHDLWLLGHPTSSHAVDVTDTFELKLAAILAHESQHPDPALIEPRMRGFLGANAQRHGLPEGRLAEAFFVVRIL